MIVARWKSGPIGAAHAEAAAADIIRDCLRDEAGNWSVEALPDTTPLPPVTTLLGPTRPASWRQITSYDLPVANRDNSLSSSDAMLTCTVVVPAGTRFCGVAFIRRELRLFAMSPATQPTAFESREIEIHRESSTLASSPNDPRGLIGLAVQDDYAYLVFERTKPPC